MKKKMIAVSALILVLVLVKTTSSMNYWKSLTKKKSTPIEIEIRKAIGKQEGDTIPSNFIKLIREPLAEKVEKLSKKVAELEDYLEDERIFFEDLHGQYKLLVGFVKDIGVLQDVPEKLEALKELLEKGKKEHLKFSKLLDNTAKDKKEKSKTAQDRFQRLVTISGKLKKFELVSRQEFKTTNPYELEGKINDKFEKIKKDTRRKALKSLKK
ncbi:hypothetical protein KAH94_06585 [bacterium]|nr:hypothetical protein [bacterium]